MNKYGLTFWEKVSSSLKTLGSAGRRNVAESTKPSATTLKAEGNRLLSSGNLDAALQCYLDATHADPSDAFAFLNLGFALSEKLDWDAASTALYKAIEIEPSLRDAHFVLGTVNRQMRNSGLAVSHFSETLKIDPDFELGYCELGYELFLGGDTGRAELTLLEGIARFPKSSRLLSNLSSLYCTINMPLKAIGTCEALLALVPNNVLALSNLGLAQNLLGNSDLGVLHLREAAAKSPNDPDLQTNLGLCLFSGGHFRESVESYDRAIAMDPAHAGAHTNRGLAYMLQGDLERGWIEHEWRTKEQHDRPSRHKDFPKPLWLGKEAIVGKTILLHYEQGLGDTIQFARFAENVAALGANVLLKVKPGLGQLLANVSGVARIVEETETPPYFDFHCPLMSLPLALGYRSENELKRTSPYLFAHPKHTAKWIRRLDKPKDKGAVRIGVAWAGNPHHRRDRQRSIKLVEFVRTLPSGIDAFCLHPNITHADVETLSLFPDVTYLGAEIQNFSDTAAVIATLDLIISVDTSVVHLAGAMGKPVWVLVTKVPDWRWGLDREDSYWYSSARVFRQKVAGDWSQTLQEVHDALLEFIDRESSNAPR